MPALNTRFPAASPQNPAFAHTSHAKKPYYRAHSSIGATGHWIKTAGLLAPLIIGEFIKDPGQKWRAVRIASVATALISEGLWTHRVHKEREEAKELAALQQMQF